MWYIRELDQLQLLDQVDSYKPARVSLALCMMIDEATHRCISGGAYVVSWAFYVNAWQHLWMCSPWSHDSENICCHFFCWPLVTFSEGQRSRVISMTLILFKICRVWYRNVGNFIRNILIIIIFTLDLSVFRNMQMSKRTHKGMPYVIHVHKNQNIFFELWP